MSPGDLLTYQDEGKSKVLIPIREDTPDHMRVAKAFHRMREGVWIVQRLIGFRKGELHLAQVIEDV